MILAVIFTTLLCIHASYGMRITVKGVVNELTLNEKNEPHLQLTPNVKVTAKQRMGGGLNDIAVQPVESGQDGSFKLHLSDRSLTNALNVQTLAFVLVEPNTKYVITSIEIEIRK